MLWSLRDVVGRKEKGRYNNELDSTAQGSVGAIARGQSVMTPQEAKAQVERRLSERGWAAHIGEAGYQKISNFARGDGTGIDQLCSKLITLSALQERREITEDVLEMAMLDLDRLHETQASRRGGNGDQAVIDFPSIEELAATLEAKVAAGEVETELPAQQERAFPRKTAPRKESATLPKVLLVDPAEDARTRFARALAASFEVVEAADGEGAWDILLQRPEIALVITELAMSRVDGFGLARRIREATSPPHLVGLPIIVLTGRENAEAKMSVLKSGANDFITKEIDPRELGARALARYKSSRAAPISAPGHGAGSASYLGRRGGEERATHTTARGATSARTAKVAPVTHLRAEPRYGAERGATSAAAGSGPASRVYRVSATTTITVTATVLLALAIATIFLVGREGGRLSPRTAEVATGSITQPAPIETAKQGEDAAVSAPDNRSALVEPTARAEKDATTPPAAPLEPKPDAPKIAESGDKTAGEKLAVTPPAQEIPKNRAAESKAPVGQTRPDANTAREASPPQRSIETPTRDATSSGSRVKERAADQTARGEDSAPDTATVERTGAGAQAGDASAPRSSTTNIAPPVRTAPPVAESSGTSVAKATPPAEAEKPEPQASPPGGAATIATEPAPTANAPSLKPGEAPAAGTSAPAAPAPPASQFEEARVPNGRTEAALPDTRPVAPEVAPRPPVNEISRAELQSFVTRFASVYEAGDLEQFMNLFVEGARTNDRNGRQGIRRDYESLFGTTDFREMKLGEINWELDGDEAHGWGEFDVRVRRRGEREPYVYTGSLSFALQKVDGRLRIARLYHGQRRADNR